MARRVLHLLRSQDTLCTCGRVAYYPNNQRTDAAGPVLKKNPYSMQQGEVKKPPRCAPCACAPNCTTPTVKRKGPALTQLKMPACGVSIERQSGVALPPKD